MAVQVMSAPVVRQSLWQRYKAPATLLVYGIVGFLVFSPILSTLLRSDYWLIRVLFAGSDWSLNGITKVMTFELLGNPRSQGLAHLMIFAEYSLFHDNALVYHVLNVALHVVNGFLIFQILSRLNTHFLISAVLGLLFIVLPSQFEIVVWTYHIYLLVGTGSFLVALLLAQRYARSGRSIHLYGGLALCLLWALLYEAAIMAPIALAFVIWSGRSDSTNGLMMSSVSRRKVVYGVLGCYLAFLLSGLFVLRVAGGQRDMSLLGDVISIPNLFLATEAVLRSLWENIFLKNIGIAPDIRISDIVYLYLPRDVFASPTNIVSVLIGAALLGLCRLQRRQALLVGTLFLLALSYLFVLSAGRLTTNSIEYVLTQPRHFYFPNALMLVCLGLLLQKSATRRALTACVVVMLSVVTLVNAGIVRSDNDLLARTMAPIDGQYERLYTFLRDNPSARVFLDFVPDNRRKLNLGLEVAFDALYQETNRITKSVKAATHVYDSQAFRSNDLYDPASIGPFLGDFTVQWQFWVNPDTPLKRDVAIIGSGTGLPRILVTADNAIRLDMLNGVTGKVDEFGFKLPPLTQLSKEMPYSGGWPEVIIEKDGDELCFIVNGTLRDKVRLTAPYLRWSTDGIGLLGQVYWGAHEMIFATRLFVEIDGAKYAAAGHNIGDRLNKSVFAPW